LCGVLAVLAAAARLRFATGGTPPRLFYGWAVLGALTFLGLAGAGEASAGLTFMHRTLWLAASLGVIVLGRADRHGFSTTVGVISLLGAILAVLLDLGLGLMAAAGLFTGFAVVTAGSQLDAPRPKLGGAPMSLWRAGRIAGVGLCAALGLVGLVAWEARARAEGEEVRLAVEAFDPRNLLTGHYAALEFVDRLPEGATCPRPARPTAAVVSGSFSVARAGGTSRRRPSPLARRRSGSEAGAIVRGQVVCQSPGAGPVSRGLPGVVRTDLGVERFYADQKRAQAIEAALRKGAGAPSEEAPAALAVLSIGRDGRARLKGLIVDGRKIDLPLL
jgi:hypothetical protein